MMNLVALLLLPLHLFIVSCVDTSQVVLMVSNITLSFDDMESDFSPSVKGTVKTGMVYVAEPLDACQDLRNKPKQSRNVTSPFVLIIRGGCTFEYKVRNAQRSGFKAAIVYDNADRNFLLAMGGDSYGIKIQAVFVTKAAGETLKKYVGFAETEVMLIPSLEYSVWSLCKAIAWILLLAVVVLAACAIVCRHCTGYRNTTSQFHGMSSRMVKAMPSVRFTYEKEDNMTSSSCAICLEDYSVGDTLRVLPCSHKFHAACVDSWLTSWRTFCPVCKRDARTSADEPPPALETTPLLSSSITTSSSSSHHSWSYPINVSHVSRDLKQQALLSLQSSSQRSDMSCRKSFHSLDYSTMSPLNPSNASPGLFSSTNHRFYSLLSNHTASAFVPGLLD
ncbi:Receptor homology region, transmembrane domain- and RING domain-containing protein 3 [Cardamine amara subsp. amara]|uniref:Receptor homology region, transmembrane domain-and RING domain-containing protein 3 n=1 Tax=Cardamine amara subsp. amara TaxID=228776 RepID=A0ABD1C4U9_CARAN